MASRTLALGMLSNNSSEQNAAGLKVGLRQHTVGGKTDEPLEGSLLRKRAVSFGSCLGEVMSILPGANVHSVNSQGCGDPWSRWMVQVRSMHLAVALFTEVLRYELGRTQEARSGPREFWTGLRV